MSTHKMNWHAVSEALGISTETCTVYRAEYMGLTDGGEHSRVNRPRKAAVRPDKKHRWRRIL